MSLNWGQYRSPSRTGGWNAGRLGTPTMGVAASAPYDPAAAVQPMVGLAKRFVTGGGGYLPYTKELDAGMGRLGGLIDEVSNTQAPARLLDAATFGARQEAAARGLEGGVAASLGTAAQGNVQNAWEEQRHQRMSALLGQQIAAITGIQGQEQQRRMLMAQLRAAQAAGDQEKANKLWGVIAGLGGAGIALATGNPALIPAGFQAGYGLGSTASNYF